MKLGELTHELAEELAQIIQKVLGWSEEERIAEIASLMEP
jgi:hypothetical protein